MNAQLAESYAICADIARRASSSFYYTFYLLPRPQRRAMHALYAYLRRTDDLVDSDEPVAQRRAALEQWREHLAAALDHGALTEPSIWPALADTVRRYNIPHEYLWDVIAGVEQDLEPRHYATFEELEGYCYRVASVVGMACIHVWGFNDQRALAAATRCGIALQLTNILRDLAEDARVGRVYLPEQELARFDYSSRELLSGVVDRRYRELLQWQVARAERYYSQAAELSRYLPGRGRRVFGATFDTYHALLDEVRRRRGRSLDEPIRLAKWRRLRIVARWALPWARQVAPLLSAARPATATKL